MAKTQKKKESLETKDVKINEKGEIKEPLNLSVIKPDEIFSYLGEKYVVQLKQTDKLDKDGERIPKEFILPAGKIIDGWVKGKPLSELYTVVSKITSPKKTISDYGRPLSIRVSYIGPINADEVFTVAGHSIKYDNVKLNDRVLLKDGVLVAEKDS